MIFLFEDKYSYELKKFEADSKEEALIFVIKHMLNNNTPVDEICGSLDIEITALDDIENI